MTLPTDNLLAYVIYARKSSESEDRQVLSIDSQVKELKEFADAKGLRVADVLTEARSAKSTGRPVFDLMTKNICTGKIYGIIAWKLDRLSRNPLDGATLIQALETNHLKQIVTPGQTYQNSTNDKFSLSIELCLAKRYVDDLSDNVKRGNRAKLEKGWLPGSAPIGYLNDLITKTVICDPDRFRLTRLIWEMVLKGQLSVPRIIEIINKQYGFQTRRTAKQGGRPLSKTTVYDLLSNPFYYGLIVRNGETYQGAHVPMVTKAEFDRVQEILKRKSLRKPKVHGFPYTGLIRCGECGAMVTAEQKINRYGSRYVYYHCTKRLRDKQCRQKCIREEELERQMEAIIEDLSIHDDFRDYALHRLQILHQQESGTRQRLTENVDSALTAVQKRLDNLLDLRLRDLLTDAEYNNQKRTLLDEITSLKENRANLERRQSHWFELSENAFLFANKAKYWFEHGDLRQKREIIACIGSNFILKDKKLLIEAKKPFLIIKEGSHSSLWQATADNVRTYFTQNHILWQIPKYTNQVDVDKIVQPVG